jgi:hypothetical protein
MNLATKPGSWPAGITDLLLVMPFEAKVLRSIASSWTSSAFTACLACLFPGQVVGSCHAEHVDLGLLRLSTEVLGCV